MKASPLLQKQQDNPSFQQPQQKLMKHLIASTWAVASTTLWLNKSFSEKDEAYFHELIAEHFFNGKDAKLNFKELVGRLCLTNRYASSNHEAHISHPQHYLNIQNQLGLAGTQALPEQMLKEVPNYKKGIAKLAGALLDFVQEPGSLAFHKGRKQLMEQNQFDLLQVYNNTIIHLQYH